MVRLLGAGVDKRVAILAAASLFLSYNADLSEAAQRGTNYLASIPKGVDRHGQLTERLGRDLQECQLKSVLSAGICDADQLLDQDGYQRCANECIVASCCQGECLEACMPTCLTYMPCQNLFDLAEPPADSNANDDVGSSMEEVLSVDYFSGFNLHFQIDELAARNLMPSSHFDPLKLDGLYLETSQSGQSGGGASMSGYYTSFYAAKIGVEFGGDEVTVGRADVFTYATDAKDELSLVITAAYLEVPASFQDEPHLSAYKGILRGFASDSRSGLDAYPHIFVHEFALNEEGLTLSGGDIGDGDEIVINVTNCDKTDAFFSSQFVDANRVAWRSPVDKNINYFGDDFVSAPVSVFDIGKTSCKSSQKMGGLLQQMPASAQFAGIDFYGSPDDPITWTYEDSTDTSASDGTYEAQQSEEIPEGLEGQLVEQEQAIAGEEAYGSVEAQASKGSFRIVLSMKFVMWSALYMPFIVW